MYLFFVFITNTENMVICEICGKLISASWIRVHFANHQVNTNVMCSVSK